MLSTLILHSFGLSGAMGVILKENFAFRKRVATTNSSLNISVPYVSTPVSQFAHTRTLVPPDASDYMCLRVYSFASATV